MTTRQLIRILLEVFPERPVLVHGKEITGTDEKALNAFGITFGVARNPFLKMIKEPGFPKADED